MKLNDQIGRCINLKEIPKRIISLVPSQTELLVDLGLEESIVGITKFCAHPIHLKKEKTIIGGTKQIHLDKIKELKPDIILCNKEENTKDIVEACETICTVHVSDIFTIEDSLELINQYGAMFNKLDEAKNIVRKIESELKSFRVFIEKKSTLKVAYFIWKDPWMVAGNNTFINYLLKLNKFKNVYETENRYPKIEFNDATIFKNVDVVLLSSEPYPFKEKHIKELKVYYPKANIMLVDGEMFSWYGSRLTKSFKYFKNLHLNLESQSC